MLLASSSMLTTYKQERLQKWKKKKSPKSQRKKTTKQANDGLTNQVLRAIQCSPQGRTPFSPEENR